ncbi:MAG: S8 family serine peptidase [Gemmatimonadetes bacterium]|nr:S8 family serine peptidase [Gemmatimonadota bacterium]
MLDRAGPGGKIGVTPAQSMPMCPKARFLPVAVLVLLAGAARDAAAQGPYRSDPPRRSFLFKDARGEIAAARARGDTTVTLVVASMAGANPKVVALVTRLGGTVGYREDKVDYLRVRVPVDGAEQVVRSPLVHSSDVSISRTSRALGLAEGGAPAVEPGSTLPFVPDTTKRPWPPVLSDAPLVDRYDPVTDMGGAEWRRANPTWDGRGVTIAMIDQSMDAFLPELQVAKTLTGASTRKIVGYRTVVDIDEENDGQWFRMKDVVTAQDAKISWQGRAYTAPAPGTYRIDQLDEAVFDSLNRAGIEKDVNRDGNPAGSSRLFGILWNEATNDVWVDTDQDMDFSDEKAYTDYAVRPEFGTIGRDKPETPIRESVSFAIQIDKARKLVALNLGVASHASLVVGAAVGSRGTAGRFDGVAPGAQLVNMAEGGAAYGQTEAVIEAAKIPEVDVIFTEQSSVIARNYLLFDGRLVPTVIYGRVIEVFGKSLILPTHNYAVLAAIDDYALAPGAISIGGHESKANFFANHGVRVQHDDNLLITGGYGPMGNGALKPDIIAPSNYVSTGRGFLEGTAIPGLMQLPPGYNIAGGTSTATPTTAGAVALLISAARQANVKVDPYRLRQAIMTSGRWVSHIEANKQGNGVVNIAGAWEALKAMDTLKTAITVTSRASVRHAMAHLLATPHEGVGVFEREGWTTGDRGERTVTFTRTTGPKGALPFAIGWNGNDGTFTSANTVSLPLGTPVPVTVGIAPTTPGVHTAVMTLDYAGSPGVEYRTQATVVAATVLDASNQFVNEQKLEVPRPGMTHLYYRVPEGATTLRIDVDASKRPVSVAVTRPDTRNVTGLGSGGVTKQTVAIQDPVAGVWEVRLQDVDDTRTFDWQQAKKDEPVPNTAVTIKVSALAAQAASSTPTTAMAGGPSSTAMEVDLTNRMAAFPGVALSMPMGAVRRDAGQLGEFAQRVYDIDVPAGTTVLTARLRVTAGAAADLDLYLFDCSGKECVASRADGDATGDESVMVQHPAAGKWKVVIDASRAGPAVSYAYEDVVFNPAYGHVAVTDQPAERAMGATWSARGQAWVASMPSGREPFAAVQAQAQPKGAPAFLVGLRELQARVDRASGSGGR